MLIGISMVKDEADIIGYTLRHLEAQGVDRVIVADNLSTDATPAIVRSFAPWATLVHDETFGYYQARKMSSLAAWAYREGAEWVLPFDADELIEGPVRLKDFFAAQPQDVGVVTIQGWDYLPRRWDSLEKNPYRRFRARRLTPQPLPKVAFRAVPEPKVHMGNHGVDGVPGVTIDGLTLKHIQFRSLEQMTRKLRNGAAVYEATDLGREYGAHWRIGAHLTDEDLQERWNALMDEPCSGL